MKKTIGAKIKSAFDVVNGLMVVIAITGVIALLAVRYYSDHAMNVGMRLNAIGLEIQENNLLARRYEKDFLLNIKALGVTKAKEQHASKVAPAIARVKELAGEGARIATSPEDREKLLAMPPVADTYLTGFQDVVAAIERRGHVDSGAEGEFRTAAHEIEAMVKNQDKLEIALLTVRRSEKDYLLRGDESYINSTMDNVQKFKDTLRQTSLSESGKASAGKAADAYWAAFKVLVEADRAVAQKTAIYKDATHQLETVSDQVAKAGVEQSQASLASAATATWVSIVLMGVLSLGAIAAGRRYATHISGHITRPVTHLTDVAQRVSLGDLSLDVEQTCDDEIGELEESLGRLVAAVKYYQYQKQDADARSGEEVLS